MHILFLSQVLPYPLDAGPKLRSYFVLRHLVQQHKVTLLTFVRETDRPQHVAHLAGLCHAVHTVPMRRTRLRDLRFLAQSLVARQPFLIMRDQSQAMLERIHRLVPSGRFDVIHADQLWMAQYALAAKAASQRYSRQAQGTAPSPGLILDQHNAVHLIPQRLAGDEAQALKRCFLRREARLLAAYEADVCRRFDYVVWVTEQDRRAVAGLSSTSNNGQTPSTVIPICANPMGVRPVTRATNRQRITFLGGLHWPPNAQGITWFVEYVYPQVRAALPRAVLTVIGKDPPAGLGGEGVEVKGYVADLQPYLSETAVFVVPLHAGGGMRVKILDAWRWGLPVVSTTIGAEGIDVQDGKNLLLADTAPAFARAVIQVLTDPSLAKRLGQNGRRTVVEKYDWRVVYQAWDEVYRGLGAGTETLAPTTSLAQGVKNRVLQVGNGE
jgi:glycosyltransferase involved in cell wall biosynthesis